MTGLDEQLLWELQQSIPLEPEPFRPIGDRLGVAPAEVLERLKGFIASGHVRRIGAVFDARRLGYRSVLCAVDLPGEALADKAAVICRHPGVTHGYERGWPAELSPLLPGGPDGRPCPSFWFTLAVLAAEFDQELDRLRAQTAPYALLALPAIRRFKIDVIFSPSTRSRDESIPPPRPPLRPETAPLAGEFTSKDRAIVRRLAGDLPLVERPYAQLAAELNVSENELLQRLSAWLEQGVLRRMAIIVRHRELGFIANGMCVWNVPEDVVLEAGRRISAFQEVTHCYQRPRTAQIPFNLYAMIHTGDWEETRQLFERIGKDAGLPSGQLLLSLKEFKKTSMSYFT